MATISLNKEILKEAKSSYDSLVKENKQLKECTINIKQKWKQYQQQQQQELLQEKEYFQRPQQKRYKKVVHEEETDNEPQTEESQYIHDNKTIEQENKNLSNHKIKEKTKYLII